METENVEDLPKESEKFNKILAGSEYTTDTFSDSFISFFSENLIKYFFEIIKKSTNDDLAISEIKKVRIFTDLKLFETLSVNCKFTDSIATFLETRTDCSHIVTEFTSAIIRLYKEKSPFSFWFISFLKHDFTKQFICSFLSTFIRDFDGDEFFFDSFLELFIKFIEIGKFQRSKEILQYAIEALFKAPLKFKFTNRLFNILVDYFEVLNFEEKEIQSIFHLDTSHGMFVISSSRMLPLYVAIYNNKNVETPAKTLLDFCNYSLANSIVCHDGDVDFLFLEYLTNLKSTGGTFTFMGKKLCFKAEKPFELLLPLVVTIIKTKSSAVIFEKLLQLMNPASSSYFPEKLEYISDILQNAIYDESIARQPSYDLFRSTKIGNLRGLTSSILNKDFAFSFWVVLDIPELKIANDPLVLLHISGKPAPLALYYRESALFISFTNIDEAVVENFPSREWSFITLSFKFESEGCYLTAFVNSVEHKKILLEDFGFTESDVTLYFGSGSIADAVNNDMVGKIGPFAFFDRAVSLKDLKKMNYNEEASLRKLSEALFTSYSLYHYANRQFKFFQTTTKKNMDAFVEVITQDYDLNYMTYVLSSFSHEYSKASQLFMNVIFTSLSASISEQQKYYSIPILSRHIPKIFKGNINFTLYTFIYQSLKTILFDPLIEDILDHIIFNLSIWGQGTIDTIQKVILHWKCVVVEEFMHRIIKRWSVGRFVAMFRIFFFDSEEDEQQNSVTEGNDSSTQVNFIEDYRERAHLYSLASRFQESELEKCRERYIDFIAAYGTENITELDIECCFSHLIDEKNSKFFKHIITLIGKLCSNATIANSMNVPTRIQAFFNPSDVDLCLMNLFALESVSGENVHKFMNAAAIQILHLVDSNSILSVLITKLQNHFNMFSLCCELALRCDEQIVDGLCEALCTLCLKVVKVNTSETFQVWPIILALKTKKETNVDKLVFFLGTLIGRKNDDEYLLEVKRTLAIINYFAQLNRIRAAFVKSKLIAIVSNPKCVDSAFLIKLFDTCFEYILFEDAVSYNDSCINYMFSNSPFELPAESSESPTIYSAQDFKKLKAVSESHRLSLLFDSNGKWVDRDVSKRLFHSINALKCELSPYTRIVEYFLKKHESVEEKEEIFQIIRTLEKTAKPFDNASTHEMILGIMKESEDIVAECFSLFGENSSYQAHRSICSELDKIYASDQKYCLNTRRVIKNFTRQRNTQTFLNQERIYKRDNASCFSFCPFKLKVDFFGTPIKDKKFRYDENVQNEALKVCSVATQTDLISTHVAVKEQFVASSTFSCTIKRINKETEASINISPALIKITTPAKEIVIQLYEISFIFKRKIHQLDTGIEIFLSSGANYLLDFSPTSNEEVIQCFAKLYMPSLLYFQKKDEKYFFNNSKFTNLWLSGRISNFRYLMLLNVISGRSFNSTSMYPITPWITRSTSKDITENMRNLDHPMKYDVIQIPSDEEIEDEFHPSPMSPLILDYFLLRIEPFTSNHLAMQSGFFDNPNRLFSSMEHAVSNVCSYYGDVRELPAEFFFEPEIFMNLNKIDFGSAEGEAINDVAHPLWANNMFDFIYKHRKLLESEEVSKNLCKWIDIMWGVNQFGERAYKRGVFFYPFLLSNVWTTQSPNDKAGEQTKNAMDLYGVLPPPIFTNEHPPKNAVKNKAAYEEAKVLRASESVLFASACGEKDLFIVSKSGEIIIYNLFFEKPVQKLQKPERYMFLGMRNTLVALDKRRQKLWFMTRKEATSHDCLNADEIYGDQTYLIALRNRCAMVIYNINAYPFEHGKIINTDDVITCICLSETFGVIAYSTRGNLLHLHSLKSLKKAAVCELNSQTKEILITPAWGFICVLSTERLFTLFNVNGMKLRETILDFCIVTWSSFSSYDDFDYVLFVDSTGRVGMFEAYYPDNVSIIGEVQHKPVMISFKKELCCAEVVTIDGTIVYFPISSFL